MSPTEFAAADRTGRRRPPAARSRDRRRHAAAARVPGLAALALGAVLGTLVAALPTLAALGAGPAGGLFSFERFNDSYSRPNVVLAPVAQGPLTLRLSSPTNSLVLRSNRLRLTPLGDGTHRAEWTAEFLGKGWLVADYDLAGVPGRLEDELVVPSQTRTVVGRVRLGHGDQGFELTPVELPATVSVAIRSRLAGQVVGLCERMSILPLMALDCAGLDGALSNAAVPLPEPGDTYLLPADRLTAEDRRQLLDYLGRNGR